MHRVLFEGNATMRTTINRPIDVADLPPQIRGNIASGTIVRVSLEVLTDENGFTPEQEAAIRQAIEESRDPRNLVGPFNSAEDMIAHLHAECDNEE